MTPLQFHDSLHRDFTRLRARASEDLTARVPSCPDWTVADLVRHVAQVYLHKVECIVDQEFPSPWPPPGIDREEPIALLDRALASLEAAFEKYGPDAPAATWYPPDQTVGWWMRRMAHETLIHRVDAELAAGAEITGAPDDLAIDGTEELLECFLRYQAQRWPEDFAPHLPERPAAVGVRAGPASWTVSAGPEGIGLTRGEDRTADATVGGEPMGVLLWLWRRSGDDLPVAAGGVALDGDPAAISALRWLLYDATQ